MKRQSGVTLGKIVTINLQILHGLLILAVGWGFSLISSKEWWMFGVLAWVCAIAGGVALTKTIYEIWKLIAQDRELAAFERDGRAPRDDKLADRARQRDGGLIR
ncbi:MAG: hypothetical protein AAF360_01580 [Pseudomonadota bacterium]